MVTDMVMVITSQAGADPSLGTAPAHSGDNLVTPAS